MGERVWVAPTVAVFASMPAVLAHAHPKDKGAAQGQAREPVILSPSEGETLLFPDGRSANLKVTHDTTGSECLMVGTESIPTWLPRVL
jgi:hypothetical protein